MNVYVLIPTAYRAHAADHISKWRAMGYRVGLFTDPMTLRQPIPSADLNIHAPYPGVWRAWNALAKAAFATDADVCVLAGDDMEPDPHVRAQVIGSQYLARFPDGFGVMQPTGDRQGDLLAGRWAAERICGSPWVGRGWVTRAYRGDGPVDGRYGAFFADEALLHVAMKYSALWQRPELAQKHHHWSWAWLPKQDYHDRNNREHWERDRALFEASRASDFPEGEALHE